MYFDENTANAIDATNNALRKLQIGSLVTYGAYSDMYNGYDLQTYLIKDIVLGEYTKGFWGYKNVVFPSLMVENIETNRVHELLNYHEGGWYAMRSDKYYSYPEIRPFATCGKASSRRQTIVSSYAFGGEYRFNVLNKLEAKKLLEEMVAKQEADKRAALYAQQQQRELQRQNDAIRDEDITALLNKYRSNR